MFVIFSFLIDSLLLRLDTVSHRTIIYNVLSAFTLIEYTVFSYVLYSIIDNRIFKGIILVSSAVFFVFSIFYFFTVKNNTFDSLPASIESILIVAFSVFYLFDQMNKPQVIFIYQEPNFWFVVGFIIYFSGTLFLFIQASNLTKEVRDNFWKINYFCNIIKNILFAIAFSTKKSKNLQQTFENPFENEIFENPYKT
ncbi:MAG TPA: hypothetical protein VM101_12515 [Flavitalea sp.]|nr:hypothetical protein [Flavitalea sp.]